MPKRKATTSEPVDKENESQVEIQTTVIVPNGDLYMVFSIDGSESKRLLVSRYILCLSSKVFDAMIGDNSHFREGTNPKVSHDGFREVDFGDDDFLAMSTIVDILHLQHDRVPPCISFAQLRETALLCDKYDLVRSVGLWPAMWAKQYLDRIEKKGFEDWLLVASIFKRKEAFTRITRHLILNSKIDATTGELVTADGWPFTEGVSSTILEKIDRIRAATMSKMQKCLWQRFHGLQTTEKGRRLCSCDNEHKHERSDGEREQCDTWNLGCLIRYFPDLKNPGDNDDHHDATIMAIVNKVVAMDEFQNEAGYVLSNNFIRSHIQGTSCGYLPDSIASYMARVEGLKLEI